MMSCSNVTLIITINNTWHNMYTLNSYFINNTSSKIFKKVQQNHNFLLRRGFLAGRGGVFSSLLSGSGSGHRVSLNESGTNSLMLLKRYSWRCLLSPGGGTGTGSTFGSSSGFLNSRNDCSSSERDSLKNTTPGEFESNLE